jgi:hypothetical protein
MKIQPAFFAFALCLAMATASAQSYRWVDKDGKVVYGDVPPPGVKVTATLRPPPPSAAPPAAPAAAGKDAAKDAKKGPLTPAEQEQAFRKRKLEEEDARKKQEETLAAEQGRKQNCDRAQENVRQIEGGQRIARTDAKGERYYLDDDQRATELANARKSAADWCSSK